MAFCGSQIGYTTRRFAMEDDRKAGESRNSEGEFLHTSRHSNQTETPWIESEWLQQNSRQQQNNNISRDGQGEDDGEDGEPQICADWFADPDPMDTFSKHWKISEEESPIEVTLTGYKAELGQTLDSTGLTLWRASSVLCDFMVQQREIVGSARNILEVSILTSLS